MIRVVGFAGTLTTQNLADESELVASLLMAGYSVSIDHVFYAMNYTTGNIEPRN